MGKYLNPGNEAFSEIIKGYYIDKTGLIEVVNNTINRTGKLTCLSRPRRFGKSFTAHMLCAYYDCSCDSHELFDRYAISESKTYEEYINKFNVIVIDVTGFISMVKLSNGKIEISDIPSMIADDVRNDIIKDKSELSKIQSLEDCLLEYVKITGKKFVFIIDEWDALIREAKDDNGAQQVYLNFLRGLFKNSNVTPYVVAAAYMTGILPIKKDGSQSAISDFREYSVLDPRRFDIYTGFTEEEAKQICAAYDMDFEEAKKWYDGYSVGRIKSIYNPYSLMQAMDAGEYGSYWKKTSAADSLETYINMNFEGLKEDIVRLISGEEIEVYTNDFANDFETFTSKDDVMTLMIHLGYLAYDKHNKSVRIPNVEIREEFNSLIRKANMNKLAGLIEASKKLLSDTIAGNTDAVVSAIEGIRESDYAPNYYNNEQALRYVIKFAYVVCVDKYMKIEELPSGKGIADVVYIPKKNTPDPALVIELKWNKTDKAAIGQIKEKKYPAVLQDYGGDIVLVGINYNEKAKEHSCEIERISK